MNTGFLNSEEVAQVESIMAAYGVREFGAEVRLWGRGKAIQVSGTLDRLELSCLLAISRYLDLSPDDGSGRDAAPAFPPIDAQDKLDRLRLNLEFSTA